MHRLYKGDSKLYVEFPQVLASDLHLGFPFVQVLPMATRIFPNQLITVNNCGRTYTITEHLSELSPKSQTINTEINTILCL